MNQESEARLSRAGNKKKKGLERFMNNEALFARFLKKFPADPNLKKLREAFAANDREGALTASHTLKGVCGNLSMDVLFELFGRQVALLRQEEWDKAAAMMPEIEKVYAETLAAIEECGL